MALLCASIMGKGAFFACCTVYALHSRYANLKQVVLDELLAKHGNAQLDAKLHEASCMCTLEEEKVNSVS